MTEVPCPNPNIWYHLVLCCGLFDLDLRHNIGKARGFLRITSFVEGVEASLASFILVMRVDLTRIRGSLSVRGAEEGLCKTAIRGATQAPWSRGKLLTEVSMSEEMPGLVTMTLLVIYGEIAKPPP